MSYGLFPFCLTKQKRLLAAMCLAADQACFRWQTKHANSMQTKDAADQAFGRPSMQRAKHVVEQAYSRPCFQQTRHAADQVCGRPSMCLAIDQAEKDSGHCITDLFKNVLDALFC